MDQDFARPLEILLVDDNPADVRLAQEALREGGLTNHLSVVTDGEEAMAFLRREGAFTRAPRPDIVLLDLNLPRKDGREVLSEVKSDEVLRRIPVVVLTTSKAEEDVLRSYELHANCYITKPVRLDAFVDVLRQLEGFWSEVVRLPAA
jgi:CheY-like chemotaxis protein